MSLDEVDDRIEPRVATSSSEYQVDVLMIAEWTQLKQGPKY